MGAESLGYFVGKRLDDSIVLCNLGPGIGNTLVHLIGDLDIRIDLHLSLQRTDTLALALHRLQMLLGRLQGIAADIQRRIVNTHIPRPLPRDIHQPLDVLQLLRCHFTTHTPRRHQNHRSIRTGRRSTQTHPSTPCSRFGEHMSNNTLYLNVTQMIDIFQ